jgi:hypothetical protein
MLLSQYSAKKGIVMSSLYMSLILKLTCITLLSFVQIYSQQASCPNCNITPPPACTGCASPEQNYYVAFNNETGISGTEFTVQWLISGNTSNPIIIPGGLPGGFYACSPTSELSLQMGLTGQQLTDPIPFNNCDVFTLQLEEGSTDTVLIYQNGTLIAPVPELISTAETKSPVKRSELAKLAHNNPGQIVGSFKIK